ncbi:MAG: hypothetical protein O3B65_02700 [Chloroflexi bacterium]|nr:hypothetical protein [Chloroflexota bacterium]
MSTLFVDVDDTLLLYQTSNLWQAFLRGGVPTEPLVERICAWVGPIVIWSAGGEDYARAAGERVLGGLSFTATEKGPETYGLVQPGDVVVDNDPIPVRTYEPTADFS